MQRRTKFGLLGILALSAAFGASTLMAADQTTDQTTQAKAPKAEASATIPGTEKVIHEGATASEQAQAILKNLALMAFVDPATGALRAPTAGEVQQLAAAGRQLQSLSAQSKLEVMEFATATGGVAEEVPSELHALSLARITEDGQVEIGCSDAGAADGQPLSRPNTLEEK